MQSKTCPPPQVNPIYDALVRIAVAAAETERRGDDDGTNEARAIGDAHALILAEIAAARA